jgi:prepilin-type N-terminal cleavage/methylation domain-containing protein
MIVKLSILNFKFTKQELRENSAGFTLIELLVVIAIIGILASLAIVSFTGSQKQARDAERKSDLKQYQTSLGNFAGDNNGLYPSYTTTTDICSFAISLLDLDTCIRDPKYDATAGQPLYRYRTGDGSQTGDGSGGGVGNANHYVMWAELENYKGTAKYWVLCSNGLVGASSTPHTSGRCPL